MLERKSLTTLNDESSGWNYYKKTKEDFSYGIALI